LNSRAAAELEEARRLGVRAVRDHFPSLPPLGFVDPPFELVLDPRAPFRFAGLLLDPERLPLLPDPEALLPEELDPETSDPEGVEPFEPEELGSDEPDPDEPDPDEPWFVEPCDGLLLEPVPVAELPVLPVPVAPPCVVPGLLGRGVMSLPAPELSMVPPLDGLVGVGPPPMLGCSAGDCSGVGLVLRPSFLAHAGAPIQTSVRIEIKPKFIRFMCVLSLLVSKVAMMCFSVPFDSARGPVDK
jgi:hypothetical protein